MELTIAVTVAVVFTLLFVGLFGFILGWADRAFFVSIDPREEVVKGALPGANCGGCGYIGCGDYADAIVNKGAAIDLCPVGGTACAKKLGSIMGQEFLESWPLRPVVHCAARTTARLGKMKYEGTPSCHGRNLVGGVQSCVYGCLGGGDCERSCKYDAIHIVDGLATINYEKCVGCSACAKICPRRIITMVPFKAERILTISCSNQDFGQDVSAVCKVGCIGCKACTKQANIFSMKGNLATIDYTDYDPAQDVKTAIQKCPRKVMVTVGKPSPDDLKKTANENMSDIIRPKFETTVDKTEWRG
jgi:Na+-translocating ferredoxin:NAD+ oxidoreductase RNF subunit RnfB